MADNVADHAKVDSEVAVVTAREFAPDFKPSVLDRFDRIRDRERFRPIQSDTPTSAMANTPLAKSALLHQHLTPPTQQQQINSNNRSNYPSNTNAKLSTNTSPQKQTQFATNVAAQPSSMNLRRNSLLHKQDSFDYQHHEGTVQKGPAMPPAMLNNAMPNPNYVPAAYQQTTAAVSSPNGQSPSTMYSSEQFNAAQQRANNVYYNSLQQQQQPSSTMPASFGYTTSYINGNNGSAPSDDPMQHQQQHLPQMMASEAQARNDSIDHFDHYKRVPSRDSSMDRYARAANRMGATSSRQPSVDRILNSGVGTLNNALPMQTKEATPEKRLRGESMARQSSIGGGLVGAGGAGNGPKRASITSLRAVLTPTHTAIYSSPNQPFEDVLLRQRTLGQDIIPSPREPKRTESLYLPPKPLIGNGGVNGMGKVGGGGKQLKVSRLSYIIIYVCAFLCSLNYFKIQNCQGSVFHFHQFFG